MFIYLYYSAIVLQCGYYYCHYYYILISLSSLNISVNVI